MIEITKKLIVKELTSSDSSALSIMLRAAPYDYSRHFIPFSFDKQTIDEILATKQRDLYYGIYVNTTLAGFYMLRGFDEGYDIPSFGVCISPEFSNLGIAGFSLSHCFCNCRLNKIKKLMLKVHPENLKAKGIYEKQGFKIIGKDERNGNYILIKDF